MPAWAVRSAANGALDRVHTCYVKHVPAEARVGNGDNARVSLLLAPDGSVESAVWVDTTVTQKPARECIIEALKSASAPIHAVERTQVTIWIGLSSSRDDTTVKVEDEPNQRLTSKAIVDAVSSRMGALIACYKARLDARPDLAGRIKFRVIVAASGEVSEVDIVESVDPEVDACVAREIRTLSFPAPGDDAPVIATIPITFRSK